MAAGLIEQGPLEETGLQASSGGDAEDGARGVRFIEAVLASSRSTQKWTQLP